MGKLTAKAIRSGAGFIILARERGTLEWVALGVVANLVSARAAIMFLQAPEGPERGAAR
jgi:hypothetical protein